jgi:hypothetical protein
MADIRDTPEEDGWAEGTLRTVLQGDFYKKPTLTGLAIRAVVSAIPYVDQAADIEDTASWVIDCREKGLEDLEVKIGGLLLGIGWIPTLGSLGKGVLKAVNSPAGAKAAVKAIRGMNWLGKGNAYKWIKELASELPSHAEKAAGLMRDVLDKLSGLLVKLRPHVPAKVALKVDAWLAMVARIRASIDNMFKEAAEHLKKKLDEALAAFQKEDFAVPSKKQVTVIQATDPPPSTKIYGEMGIEKGEVGLDAEVYRIEPKDVPTPLEPHQSPYFDGRWDLYAAGGARPGDKVLYFTDKDGAADLLARKNYFDPNMEKEVRKTTVGELMQKYPDGKILEDSALDKSWIFWTPRAPKP